MSNPAVENAAPADDDDNDKGDDENASGDGGEEGDEGDIKQEYVKKVYVAKPWICTSGADKEVEDQIIKPSRPLMQMRVSRKRREFAQDGFNFIDKDASELTNDLKSITKNIMYITQKKVLDIGLQAAYKIKRIQTQTYFGRSVNKACVYDPNDFIGIEQKKQKKQSLVTSEGINEEEQKRIDDEQKKNDEMKEKLEKFIDRVAFRVEEALQSNEIINVFQDDFEMLGDEEAANGGKVNTTSMQSRTFIENDYCKGKRVTCIKFHPTKPHLVAMSMIDNMDSDSRALIQGKSFESYVLILNFSDAHIITLNYLLETPIEVTTIEFHPENPNILIGGCLNGQIVVWDITSTDHRIANSQKKAEVGGGGDDEGFTEGAVEEDDKAQSIIKMRNMCQSNIITSHKQFVADIAFVPPSVNVDRRQPSEGHWTHFISISEDAIINIWDTRQIDKTHLSNHTEFIWKPFLKLDLFKQDGSAELGLSRILLQKGQTTPTFWAVSDEGDLVLIDWSVKPVGGGDDGPKQAEYVRKTYESEREHRPALALERSPFYPQLLLTVHNFHFAIWKTDLENYEKPIFVSAMTYGAHNTCGAFSPTRPGVIFITKTNGIDVWDFLDQSNKPSLVFNFATSPFMYCKFQYFKHSDNKQYMAYGDKDNGTLFLYEVPSNLKSIQENEEENIQKFWDREIEKCLFVIDQRERKKEEFQNIKIEEERKKAILEAQKDVSEDMLMQKELEQEEAYQELLLKYKVQFGLMSEDEMLAIQARKKKK